MRRTLDLARLEQFVAVARQGSFGKAAAQLALSQPTLTRNMRSLEAEVGARLFDRGPLGTTLTATGRRFLPRAEALINDADRALAELELGGDVASVQLRVGVSPNMYFHMLDHAIGRLAAEIENVNIVLVSGTREKIVEDLRSNAVDLGLCLVPDFIYQAANEASDVSFEAIGVERVQPYVRPGHAAAGATALADLPECQWAVPHQLSVSYRFESAFYRRRLAVPIQTVNTASMSLLTRCAVDHGMVALLPARVAEHEVAAGRLVPIALKELCFEGLIGLMERQNSALSAAGARFVDHVRQIATASL